MEKKSVLRLGLCILTESCQLNCYGLVADLFATRTTSPQQVVVMAFGKRHDTTDTTDFLPAPTCYRLATVKLV